MKTNLQSKDHLKNEDNLKNKDNLKNQGKPKNEEDVISKTVHSPRLYNPSCACSFLVGGGTLYPFFGSSN